MDLDKNVLNDPSFQTLVGMYVLTVVFLVRRQLRMVKEEEEEEENGVVKAVMIDGRGKTKLKDVEKVLNDENMV